MIVTRRFNAKQGIFASNEMRTKPSQAALEEKRILPILTTALDSLTTRISLTVKHHKIRLSM